MSEQESSSAGSRDRNSQPHIAVTGQVESKRIIIGSTSPWQGRTFQLLETRASQLLSMISTREKASIAS